VNVSTALTPHCQDNHFASVSIASPTALQPLPTRIVNAQLFAWLQPVVSDTGLRKDSWFVDISAVVDVVPMARKTAVAVVPVRPMISLGIVPRKTEIGVMSVASQLKLFVAGSYKWAGSCSVSVPIALALTGYDKNAWYCQVNAPIGVSCVPFHIAAATCAISVSVGISAKASVPRGATCSISCPVSVECVPSMEHVAECEIDIAPVFNLLVDIGCPGAVCAVPDIQIGVWNIPPCVIAQVNPVAEVEQEVIGAEWLLWVANLINLLYNASQAVVVAYIQQRYPLSAVYYHANVNGLVPTCCFFFTGDRWCIVSEGTTSAQQFIAQVLGSLEGCVLQNGYDCSSVCESVASYIFGAVKPIIGVDGYPLIAVGHSYGAEVLKVCLCKNIVQGDGRPSGLISFGSPRWTGVATKRLLSTTPQLRIVDLGDPLVLLPVHAAEFLGLGGLVGNLLASKWASFVHSSSGRLLYPSGHLRSIYRDDTQSFPELLSILMAWLLDQNMPFPTAHAITTYIQRLEKSVQLSQ
jgi:hypothetical protein